MTSTASSGTRMGAECRSATMASSSSPETTGYAMYEVRPHRASHSPSMMRWSLVMSSITSRSR